MTQGTHEPFSVLDMFSIGVGPSSSHTVGPMRAAHVFVESLVDSGMVGGVARVRVVLYGSLAMTGRGHGTDRAIAAGLEGALPQSVDTAHMLTIRDEYADNPRMMLGGVQSIGFDYDRDIVFELWRRLAAHTNGMRFTAYDADDQVVDEQVWYSVGGGFIRSGHRDDLMIGIHDHAPKGSTFAEGDQSEVIGFGDQAPYDFDSCDELMRLCERTGSRVCDLVMANERAIRSEDETRARLLDVWSTMRACVLAGCTSDQRMLPGGLEVRRRAPVMYQRLSSNRDVLVRGHRGSAALESSDAAWVDLFALAVSEENAGEAASSLLPPMARRASSPRCCIITGTSSRGPIRTASCGSCSPRARWGISSSATPRYPAPRSVAREVGSACSMAAAGLCEVLGGTPRQVENAAEIGIEHHLGLTCDPVGGLVQIPCIERNAMAANTAINAVRIAMLGDGSHRVSLDQAIRTMRDTGEDMMSKYKETAQGGLAVNVVEC